jgi:hypothetical protein
MPATSTASAAANSMPVGPPPSARVGGCRLRAAELALVVPSTVRVDTAYSAVRFTGGVGVFVSSLSAAEMGAGASSHPARTRGCHVGIPTATAKAFLVAFGAGPGHFDRQPGIAFLPFAGVAYAGDLAGQRIAGSSGLTVFCAVPAVREPLTRQRARM